MAFLFKITISLKISEKFDVSMSIHVLLAYFDSCQLGFHQVVQLININQGSYFIKFGYIRSRVEDYQRFGLILQFVEVSIKIESTKYLEENLVRYVK